MTQSELHAPSVINTSVDKSDSFYVWWVCILIASVTFGVYLPVTRFPFVLVDDGEMVYRNPHVISGLNWQNAVWAFQTHDLFQWHPLAWLSHQLDCQLFGMHAGKHHLTNILFHTANAVLLFLVLLRATRDLWPPALVATIFALHPLHVESAAWVSERRDVLSMFFLLFTLWFYVGYVQYRAIGSYLAALTCFALGLMSKPMVVTLPFLLLLLDIWPFRRVATLASLCDVEQNNPDRLPILGQRRTLISLLVEKVPFICLSIISGVLTIKCQLAAHAIRGFDDFPLSVRVANALVSYVSYIRKMCWPSDLAIYYPHAARVGRDPLGTLATPALFAALFLVLTTLFVMLCLKSRPYLAVGWFWYLGSLLPVIGLVQAGSQAMADRFVYIPLLGIYVAIAWSLQDFAIHRPLLKRAVIISVSVLLVMMSVATRVQLMHWRGTLPLADQALKNTEKNYFVHAMVGMAMANSQRFDEAIIHFQRGIEIWPSFAEAHDSLGDVLSVKGHTARAQFHHHKAMELAIHDGKDRLANQIAGKLELRDQE